MAAEQLGYWTSRLGGLPECFELPADRVRPLMPHTRGLRGVAIDAEVQEVCSNWRGPVM